MRDLLVSEIQPCAPGLEMEELTLLLVEDDLMSSEMLLVQLDGLFKKIITASDGLEGFQLFCDHAPDIVLTDQIMPGISGLELMSQIRATGAKTPIVLMTSSIDNGVLLEAINVGVDRFVPKPFDFDQIIRTLSAIARDIVNMRLLEQHRRQEVELLRYRDTYNSIQQESARRKERHVVRHDLRNQVLEGAAGTRWGINVAYSPHDIMCGDGYSVRNIFDGRQLIFVVDAMGSGMSASLTAMLATSFFNYQVENLHLWEKFTLRIFLRRFQEYLTSMLLEEEVLSCGFFLVDLVQEEIKVALFALPPLLLRGVDGSVRRLRGENPPIGIYPSEVNISTVSLEGVADLLVMTDGVSDAPLTQGGSYREVIEDDFREAPTLAALQRRFMEKTDPDAADDLTLLHLRRLDFASSWKWQGTFAATPEEQKNTIRAFLDELSAETVLDFGVRVGLEVTLMEALANAHERTVDDEDSAIKLIAALWRGAGRPLLILEVCDNKCGLPGDVLNTIQNDTSATARGLQKVSLLNDSLFIGGPGGCLIILKTLERGAAHADNTQQQ
jgi:CheY-like chemotaxis protein